MALTKPYENMKNTAMNAPVNQEINKIIMDPEVTISFLIRHDSKAKDPKVSLGDYVRHGNVISSLLETVEKEFDTDYMIKLYRAASQRAGHSIGPMNHKVLQNFKRNGCTAKIINGSKYVKTE